MVASIPSNQAHRLLPLLRSIGEEIVERASRVLELESMASALSVSPRVHGAEIAAIRAELADVKRELRHAEEELERLGCAIDGLAPLTFRIAIDEEDALTWRLGDAVLTKSAG